MNLRKAGSLLLALFLLASPGGVFAQDKPLEMKWTELAALVTGHHAAVQLSDGSSVKGEVIAVREDALLLDVSSAVKGYPRGNGSIPRASVALIDVERARGAWGRTLGTVIGALGGMTLGGYLITRENSSAGQGLATFLGVAVGGSLGRCRKDCVNAVLVDRRP